MGLTQEYPFGDFRWFIYLAEQENISAVAQELYISQPTLSRNLAQLETSLGIRLFDRIGKRIVLNNAGKIAYDHLRRAQAELQTATHRIHDSVNPISRSISLGFLHSFGYGLVPEIAQAFRSIAPEVSLFLTQGSFETLGELVISGSVDVGIISPRPETDLLRWDQIFLQELALIVPDQHRLADRKEIDVIEIADDPFIIMQVGYGLRKVVEKICADADFRPNITIESGDIATIKGFVRIGLGVSIVPLDNLTKIQHMGMQDTGLRFIRIAHVPSTREVGLIHSTQRALSTCAQNLVNFILSTYTDQT